MSILRPSNNAYLIDINDYEIIRNINRGGFGTINLVQHKESKEQFASKTNLVQNTSQNKLFISREVHILIQVQHPTIIQFRGFSYIDFNGDKNITILMDYMKEGSLAHLINQESRSLAPPDYDNTKRQIILVGIARGMMILHALHIIHRDLKPENILLDSDFHPHITDFGLSKFFDPHHSMSQSIFEAGTAAYMAPEVIHSNHFNTKADVYAFGILMYEVVSGKRAYHDLLYGRNRIPDFQFKTRVTEGLRPEFDFPIKPGLRRMIEQCWSNDPKLRPTFSEIFKKLSLSGDDYFAQFDGNIEKPIINDDDIDDDEDDDLEMGLSKKFCLENVDAIELLDYVDEIKVEPTKEGSLKNEITKMRTELNEKTEMISNLQKELKEAKEKIASLQQSFGRFFSVDLSSNMPGILCQLKNRQRSPFDRFFVTSQSSNDIYSVLIPDSKDAFCIPQLNNYIEFEFQNSIAFNGIEITTFNDYFPKSFDILIEGKVVKSITDEVELNGQYKKKKFDFHPVAGKKVRLTNKGSSWDKPKDRINIKGIELLSNEANYPNGVFAKLISESDNKDPHKCPVIASASFFDHNSFHLIDSSRSICTYQNDNSWFQIELTQGTAILIGYRLKNYSPDKLKSYKIIATTDSSLPESSWSKLIEINEKTREKSKNLDFYRFSQPSQPVKFIRIVLTGPTWNDAIKLKFCHLDFFGTYL